MVYKLYETDFWRRFICRSGSSKAHRSSSSGRFFHLSASSSSVWRLHSLPAPSASASSETKTNPVFTPPPCGRFRYCTTVHPGVDLSAIKTENWSSCKENNELKLNKEQEVSNETGSTKIKQEVKIKDMIYLRQQVFQQVRVVQIHRGTSHHLQLHLH